MSPPPAAVSPRLAYGVLGAVSGVTVAYEVVLTRLLSVTTWYSLVFAVLSIAMLGLTRGAISAHRPDAPLDAAWLERRLILFAASLAVAGAVANVVPIWLAVSWKSALAFAWVALCSTVPFVLGGSLVARLLNEGGAPVGRLYGVDLGAASAGALLPLALLGPLGALGALFALAALVAGVAVALGRRGAAAALAGTLLLLAGATRQWPDRFRPAMGDKNGSTMDLSRPVFEGWNALSYVVAPRFEASERPFLWSDSSAAMPGRYEQSLAIIDGEAATPIAAYASLADVSFLRHDVTTAAHLLRPDGTACVIGVGGGRDILAALEAGHPRVVAAEINPAVVAMLRSVAARSPVAADPRVELVAQDGRQRFGSSQGECRVLQASLVDTWAATGAGAFAHSEATLYTREAWAGFLRAVEPDGLLTFSRWYSPADVNETSRLVALAAAALLDRGAPEPRAHIALLSGGKIATLLVSPKPLSADDVGKLAQYAEREGRQVLLLPGRPAASSLLERLLSAKSVDALAEAGASSGLDTSAPSDERPFFFQILRGKGWFGGSGAESGIVRGNTVAASVLGLTFVVLVVLAAAFLLPSLGRVRGEGRFGARTALYFGALGCGFMIAEVALVQRMHLVLAHPTLALVFVLAGLLAAMGVGSALSGAALTSPRRVMTACVVAAVLLAVLPFGVIHPLAEWTRGAPLALRAVWATGVSAGLGLVLGALFPSGLRHLPRADDVPLAFAVNGAAGVVGGLLGVVVSVTQGIPQSFYLSAVLYAVAAACASGLAAARNPAA